MAKPDRDYPSPAATFKSSFICPADHGLLLGRLAAPFYTAAPFQTGLDFQESGYRLDPAYDRHRSFCIKISDLFFLARNSSQNFNCGYFYRVLSKFEPIFIEHIQMLKLSIIKRPVPPKFLTEKANASPPSRFRLAGGSTRSTYLMSAESLSSAAMISRLRAPVSMRALIMPCRTCVTRSTSFIGYAVIFAITDTSLHILIRSRQQICLTVRPEGPVAFPPHYY